MSVSPGDKARRGFVVGRLLYAFDKEIARSVLFLSPVLATRQSPASDSDMLYQHRRFIDRRFQGQHCPRRPELQDQLRCAVLARSNRPLLDLLVTLCKGEVCTCGLVPHLVHPQGETDADA